jgi:NTP pyrophosphatase (non-canonical NTP hydrolase)
VKAPEAMQLIIEEFGRTSDPITGKKPYNSPHEGYAVILEELDELFDEVKIKREHRDPGKMRAEACQVAACALRFMVDLT